MRSRRAKARRLHRGSGKPWTPTWAAKRRLNAWRLFWRRSARYPTWKSPRATSGRLPDLLIDTDVFIDHLRGARALTAGDERLFYSVVTRCELFAGSKDDEAKVALLLSPFTELNV